MHLLDLTLETPEQNLALDEALLEHAEAQFKIAPDVQPVEVIRIWEPQDPMVVLGRSSPVDREVDVDYCRTQGIPVYRRSSGGQTILTGPGCLMYCVLLSYQDRPELRMLDSVHQFVTARLLTGLTELGVEVKREGTCDLTWQGRKFSGNSLRCKRQYLIYHGTLLYNLSIELIERALRPPIREPEYRKKKPHSEFLVSLPLKREEVIAAIQEAFPASGKLEHWPQELTRQLVKEKYSRKEWNFRH